MLYVLRPNGVLMSTDLPNSELARMEAGTDVALVGEFDELRADEVTVRLALRHGEPCSAGLVLSGGLLAIQAHPDQLVQLQANSREAHRASEDAWGERLEQMSPGRAERRGQLDDAVDEDRVRSIAMAEREIEEQLQATPRQALVAHWQALGGDLPDPL
jgi:hypothetical protein